MITVSAIILFLLLSFRLVYVKSYGAQAKEVGENIGHVMGDYEGSYTLYDGTESPLAAQVIDLGKENYRANFLSKFDQSEPPTVVLNGQKVGSTLHFTGMIEEGEYYGVELEGDIEGEVFRGNIVYDGNEVGIFEMKKIVHLSPTLGAEPPADAIVLFDGTNFDQWEQVSWSSSVIGRIINKFRKKHIRWKLDNSAMEVKPGTGSIITKREFANFKLHLEFRTPFIPEARGQDRGNSGVYLQGRYEIQVLDSYGLEGLDNECGGIYKVAAPSINMCAPPLQWQTYDITFQAPRFNPDGKKIENARLTVLHNGIQIHDSVEVPSPTGSAMAQNVIQTGGIYLQDHGNRVQYRNIWLIERSF